MSEKSIIDKALEVLERTNDGDDLSPTHLKLLEMAVNNFLNEEGVKMFNDIHKQVMNGEYKQPYLNDVEFMTRDHEGYVYFKGQNVEHFSGFYAYSLDAKNYLERLQSRCLFLENKGLNISFGSVTNMPDELEKEYMNGILHQLHSDMAEHSIIFSQVKCDNDNSRSCEYIIQGCPSDDDLWTNKYALDFVKNNSDSDISDGVFNANVTTYSLGKGQARDATEEELKSLNLCFDYLLKNNMLHSVSKSSSQLDLNQILEDENEDEAEM